MTNILNLEKNFDSLEGKTVVVTGASQGIGLATAGALAKRGARLALVARNDATLSTATKLPEGDVRAYRADMSDWRSIGDVVDQIASDFGGIDGLVSNAAMNRKARVEKLDPDDVLSQITTNMLGPMFLSKAVIPHFRKRGGGRILFVSSSCVAHYGEGLHLSVYAATKAGMERFAREMREEGKHDNIGVTIFSPGGTLTNFGRTRDAETLLAEEIWAKAAPTFDGIMAAEAVGEAIARCLEAPDGTAFDYVALRPNRPMPRILSERPAPAKGSPSPAAGEG
jgi:3-oxoacyl-[acyl-carrier protein] reductase